VSSLEGQPSVADVQTASPRPDDDGGGVADNGFDADVILVDVSSQDQIPIQDAHDGASAGPAIVALVDLRDHAQVAGLIRRGARAVLPMWPLGLNATSSELDQHGGGRAAVPGRAPYRFRRPT